MRKVSDTLWEMHPSYQHSERVVVVVPQEDNTLVELTFQRLGKRPHLVQCLYWITSTRVLNPYTRTTSAPVYARYALPTQASQA